MAVGRARHTGHERAGLFTDRNTKDAKGFRDSPNPDSGRVKKVGGISGGRTGHQQHFDILVYSTFLSINNHIAYINRI